MHVPGRLRSAVTYNAVINAHLQNNELSGGVTALFGEKEHREDVPEAAKAAWRDGALDLLGW